jgi:hypothetical protein
MGSKAGGFAPRPPPGIAPIPGPLHVLALGLEGLGLLRSGRVAEGGASREYPTGCADFAPPSATRLASGETHNLPDPSTNKWRSRIDTILAGPGQSLGLTYYPEAHASLYRYPMP